MAGGDTRTRAEHGVRKFGFSEERRPAKSVWEGSPDGCKQTSGLVWLRQVVRRQLAECSSTLHDTCQ